jgi:gp16 family phage-associated protein
MGKPSLTELKRRAKQNLREQGISAAEFARFHGFNVSTVYNVMNNPDVKAHRGEAHRIAVALGIKAPPSPDKRPLAA